MSAAGNSPKAAPRSPETFNPNCSQSDFETAFFGEVLDRLPNYVDALKIQSGLLAGQGRHEQCLPLNRRLVSLLPGDGIAHYNLACSLARVGRTAESLVVLTRALQLGYDDFAHLEFDSDLDNLRHLAGYRELMRSYGVKA